MKFWVPLANTLGFASKSSSGRDEGHTQRAKGESQAQKLVSDYANHQACAFTEDELPRVVAILTRVALTDRKFRKEASAKPVGLDRSRLDLTFEHRGMAESIP
jgi:hypothetical protein